MNKPSKKVKKRAQRRKGPTWTKPESANEVHVVCVGAGGSGGSGKSKTPFCGLDPQWHWKTKDGRIIHISEMDVSHLINARSLLCRRMGHMRLLARNMTRTLETKLREEGHDSQFEYTDETW